MEHISEMKGFAAGLVAVLTALWGWFGWVVVLLVCSMAADYGTGTAVAMQRGDWSSKVARNGLWHKLGEVIAVGVAGAVDLLIGAILGHISSITLPFDYTVMVCPLVCTWYILTELGSIVENVAQLGTPMPEFLKKLLRVSTNAVDDAGDKLTGTDTEEK